MMSLEPQRPGKDTATRLEPTAPRKDAFLIAGAVIADLQSAGRTHEATEEEEFHEPERWDGMS